LVVGLAPDGGRLPPEARKDVKRAIQLGLHVDSGLHDYLSEDPELARAAQSYRVRIRDIRKPRPADKSRFFTGKIEEVTSFKVAVLGTDSAIGKRTTAWLLVDGLREIGRSAELVGTGQTAWMQGARYSVILDTLLNDFLTGEIEHAVWLAWQEQKPDAIVIEGQGGLLNPAYPGGYEILAAAKPDAVVLQHAPARQHYDGFPRYPMHPLKHQIQAIEVVSGRPVVAVTLNHENIPAAEIPAVCESLSAEIGLPVYDVLRNGGRELCEQLVSWASNPANRPSHEAHCA
jgi:uncharacterized NAD-dependent epimerase/dehydratase family protein